MHVIQPRIAPLEPEEWDQEVQELLAPLVREDGRVDNLYTTLARHPKLLKRWRIFGAHILGKSTLPVREREIVILRLGWLCQSEYEWRHHVVIGKQAGLDDEDIERIRQGPAAAGLDPFEAALIRAVDELQSRCFVTDSTWAALTQRYDERQMLDLLFTVGQYRMLAMMLRSTGVQLEDRVARQP